MCTIQRGQGRDQDVQLPPTDAASAPQPSAHRPGGKDFQRGGEVALAGQFPRFALDVGYDASGLLDQQYTRRVGADVVELPVQGAGATAGTRRLRGRTPGRSPDPAGRVRHPGWRTERADRALERCSGRGRTAGCSRQRSPLPTCPNSQIRHPAARLSTGASASSSAPSSRPHTRWAHVSKPSPTIRRPPRTSSSSEPAARWQTSTPHAPAGSGPAIAHRRVGQHLPGPRCLHGWARRR